MQVERAHEEYPSKKARNLIASSLHPISSDAWWCSRWRRLKFDQGCGAVQAFKLKVKCPSYNSKLPNSVVCMWSQCCTTCRKGSLAACQARPRGSATEISSWPKLGPTTATNSHSFLVISWFAALSVKTGTEEAFWFTIQL